MLHRAYGLTISGLPRAPELELAARGASRGSPTVEVRSDPWAAAVERDLDDHGGVRRLRDGRLLTLDRERSLAVFHGPALSPDLLAHPYLGPVATAFSRWAGRESFHAGAFVSEGRAWAVTGPRTAGKSTLLAALAARATAVLADDVLITDGEVVFPGPRCLDLRDAPPFGGLDLRPARRDERLRLRLPGVPDLVPLGGWFFLSWADDVAVERIGPAALLATLSARRAAPRLRSDPAVLLALGTLPAWHLTRPRRFDAVPSTLALVDETVARTVGAGPAPAVHR